jgi:hypothetical protein
MPSHGLVMGVILFYGAQQCCDMVSFTDYYESDTNQKSVTRKKYSKDQKQKKHKTSSIKKIRCM